MGREDKVKEGEIKGGELMVKKWKRGVLLGKREGSSTPSPTWKFGLIQSDGALIPDFNFSTQSNTLSARKLGANLWEMETQLNPRPNISKNEPIFSHHKSQEKKIQKELDQAPVAKSPSKPETSRVNVRKQPATSLAQHTARVDKVGHAQQPLSPASYPSSMEMASHRSVISPMASHRSVISPNSSLLTPNGKFGESSHSIKTSTELLKVLNRIWSLEEKHALDMSLVKTIRRELDQSETRIQQLIQEKKRDQNEIGNLMKQIREYKVAKKKEQERIQGAVKLVEEKLENEMRLRRHSEKRHHKLAKELSEIKSSFSNALREIKQERKARVLLEDLCDEFAKGIRDYEQEVRFMKQKSGREHIGREGNDRFILHVSEAWLDGRGQMQLADAHDVSEKQSPLDKLCHEIESFLREKQSADSGKNQDMSLKTPRDNNVPPRSLESLQLNEPASAPWNAKDEEDSVGITDRCPQLCRGCSLKQGQQGEITSGGHDKETTKSRMENLNETSNTRMPRKGETLQRSSREGKDRVIDGDMDLEEMKGRHDKYNSLEGSFDPSTFMGPPSPVKKWTSEVSVVRPDVSESSLRWPKGTKPNTLKAKLIEARLERQQFRARSSSQVE